MDEALKDGVIKDRGCTDIICVLIFLAFLVGMFACVGIGYSKG